MKEKIKIIVLVCITTLALNVFDVMSNRAVDASCASCNSEEYEIDGFDFKLSKEWQTAVVSNVNDNHEIVENLVFPDEVIKDGITYKVIAVGGLDIKTEDGKLIIAGVFDPLPKKISQNLKTIKFSKYAECIMIDISDPNYYPMLQQIEMPSETWHYEWENNKKFFNITTIDPTNKYYYKTADGNSLIHYDKYNRETRLEYVNVENILKQEFYIIPEGVEIILPDILRMPKNINDSLLKNVIFPNSLKTICSDTFYNFKDITDIRLPLTLDYLGQDFRILANENEGFMEVFMIPNGVDLDNRKATDSKGLLFNSDTTVVVYTSDNEDITDYIARLRGKSGSEDPKVFRASIDSIQPVSANIEANKGDELDIRSKFSAPLIFYKDMVGEEIVPNDEINADSVLSTVEIPLDYSIIGNNSGQTTLDPNGILKIGKDETSENITVHAEYYLNPDKNADLIVSIKQKDDSGKDDNDKEDNNENNSQNGSHSSNASNKVTKPKEGWFEEGGQTYYVDSKGNYLTGFHEISKDLYYFDQKGVMTKGTWFVVDDEKYYAYHDGTIARGWLPLETDWYYMDDVNGHMIRDWVKDDGDWYFMGPEGEMWRQCWAPGDHGNWYYVDIDGKMIYDTWIPSHSGFWYYVGPDGQMAINAVVDGCCINSLGIYKSPIYIQ